MILERQTRAADLRPSKIRSSASPFNVDRVESGPSLSGASQSPFLPEYSVMRARFITGMAAAGLLLSAEVGAVPASCDLSERGACEGAANCLPVTGLEV